MEDIYITWTLVSISSSITGGCKIEALEWKIELIGVASGKKEKTLLLTSNPCLASRNTLPFSIILKVRRICTHFFHFI